MSDLISREDVLHELDWCDYELKNWQKWKLKLMVRDIPSAQQERLTDDDFEAIRIHLNAYKEKLCNQQRWEEAEEYQRIIDRFMAFASAQTERKKGEWRELTNINHTYICSVCGRMLVNISEGKNNVAKSYPFCHCGADMRENKK